MPWCISALLPLNGSVQGAHNPQGARRIRKAAKPPTAAQYFKIFKPISWGERPAERRSRFIQRFLKETQKPHSPVAEGLRCCPVHGLQISGRSIDRTNLQV